MKTLVFFYEPGCPACAATKPVVASFARAFGKEVNVVSVDSSDMDSKLITTPEMIPAFMVIEKGKKPRTISGRQVTVGALAGWVFR